MDDNFNENLYETLHNENLSDIEIFKHVHPLNLWREYGFFDDSDLENVNRHWLTFPSAGKFEHRTLAALYTLIMTIGLIGNSLELYLFARCKSLRTPANILVVNLALSDFMMMAKMPIFIYNSLFQGPALGSIACQLYGFIGGLTGTASICTLAAIAFDRQRIVSNPLQPMSNVSSMHARRAICCIWLYSLIFSSIPLAKTRLGAYVPEGYLTSCSFDYLNDSLDAKLFILVFFVAAWVVPFIVIMFSYIRILLVVKQAREFSAEVNRRVHNVRRPELKIASIIIVIISVWFIAWTPYALVALLGVFGRGDLITPLTSMIPALFCKTASCIDPFIYGILHPRYRKEIRFICSGKKENHGRRTHSSLYTISVYRRKEDHTERESPLGKSSILETRFTDIKTINKNSE